jgi:hypothetical protein
VIPVVAAGSGMLVAMSAVNRVLEVDRADTATTRLAEEEASIVEGQVRLRVDRFAVTANNVTYAAFGDALGYWDFFPAADGWGRVPAMGWATVVESGHPDVDVGSRYYGWYPMADHVALTVTPTVDGLRDDGAHRQAHARVYRAYVDVRSDPLYDPAPDGEDRHALLRGLCLTGFLADEHFADSGAEPYFGAERAVVLSASSKTAIGYAQRAAARDGLEVVGVTSERNLDFVTSLGCYTTAIPYDAVGSMPTGIPTVSIDMAGSPVVLAALHERLGDDLRYSMTVGRSHHDAPSAATSQLPGPQPQLFFAPTEVARRLEQWGREEYARRAAGALAEFVDGSRSWLQVSRRIGSDEVAAAWTEVRAGRVRPDVGIVASFG